LIPEQQSNRLTQEASTPRTEKAILGIGKEG
jgi:hypothetical protein